MTLPRLLCVADSHFGKARNLYPERLAEQSDQWRQILRLAVELECDAILHAGDTFHRNVPTPDELAAFAVPMIEEPGPPVIAITGNVHDVANTDTPAAAEVIGLTLDRLTVVRHPQVVKVGSAAICCLPWAPTSRLIAKEGTGDRRSAFEAATEGLLSIARSLREQAGSVSTVKGEEAAVLLLHWSVVPSSLPSGLPVDQLREVLLPLSELEEMGWDAIVAGHIHARQVLGAHTAAFYCGSPMPLDFGESGSEHGVWLLEPWEPRPTDAAPEWKARFMPLESRRFVTIDVPADDMWRQKTVDAGDTPDVADAIVRVRYSGTEDVVRAVDPNRIRATLIDAGAFLVTEVTPVIERETVARTADVDVDTDPMVALEKWLPTVGVNGDIGAAVLERAAVYLKEPA